MRYVLSLAFLAFTSQAIGEQLLSEVSSTFRGTPAALPSTLVWTFYYPEPGVFERLEMFAEAESVGVPRERIFAEDSPFNVHYRSYEVGKSSAYHGFSWHGITLTRDSGISDEALFVTGMHSANAVFPGIRVTSYYTPPSGNNFFPYVNFTRLEFVVDERTYGNFTSIPSTVSFTMRFYGEVPEPNSAILFVLGLCAICQRYRR